MKNKLLSSLVLAAGIGAISSSAVAAPDPNFHIYLLLGQSNMEGTANVEAQDRNNLNPKVSVLPSATCGGGVTYGVWRDPVPPIIGCGTGGGLGPGDTFGRIMAENAPDGVTIGLVGGAASGESIDFFRKGCTNCSPQYTSFNGVPGGNTAGGYKWNVDLAKKAQEAGVIKGFIFHQGESDSGSSSWLTRVNTYVTNLRTDLGLEASEVPFIAGELPYGACCDGHNSIIRNIPNTISNGHYVTAEGGLGLKDQYHWNSAAVRTMGERYATKMLAVGSFGPADCGDEPGTGTPICCNISADPDGDGNGTQNGAQCVVTEGTKGWHPANPADVAVAINVGGSGDAIEYDGVWYTADQYSDGGTPNATSDSVSGGNGNAIFTSERYGKDFSYDIPVANGNYSVEIGLVEMYLTASGDRIINITAEGKSVVSSFDIYSEVGHDALYMTDAVEVTVNDGTLNIDISGATENGTLASILVRKVAANTGSSSSSSSSASSSSSSSSSSTGNPSNNTSSSSSGGSTTTTGGATGGLFLLLMSIFAASFLARRESK